jgi:hypothetical protein
MHNIGKTDRWKDMRMDGQTSRQTDNQALFIIKYIAYDIKTPNLAILRNTMMIAIKVDAVSIIVMFQRL